MNVRIEPNWKQALSSEFEKPYFPKLTQFVKDEYQSSVVYPPPKYIFHAFDLTPFDQVKVVILGQDPYHGPNQANGLAFSVNEGIQVPPSLVNIYKEIEKDTGKKSITNGNLEMWAKQGVMLLNATLTVRAHLAGSHQKKGWETFTDSVIQALSNKQENIVFMLWGAYAQKKGIVIDESKHLVLRAPHPSPLSAYNGFFGCAHFSQCNAFLMLNGKEPIDW
jgi:uracil-DNA glycosylase